MSRITTNVIGVAVSVIVIFFLGRLFFLTGIQTEIFQASQQLADGQRKLEQINAELTKIKPAPEEEATDKKQKKLDKMLKQGEESALLRMISELAGKSFRINSFDLIEAFLFKPEAVDEMTSVNRGFAAASEELPELDEQGMPVGSASDEEGEWPGVEIVPLKVTFSTTFRTLGKFLSDASQIMPINSVRSLDIIMRDNGLVNGTLVLNFPLAERK